MERSGYRETLAWLSGLTENQWLSAKDVAAILKIDAKTARRRFGIGKYGISISSLARKVLDAEETKCAKHTK